MSALPAASAPAAWYKNTVFAVGGFFDLRLTPPVGSTGVRLAFFDRFPHANDIDVLTLFFLASMTLSKFSLAVYIVGSATFARAEIGDVVQSATITSSSSDEVATFSLSFVLTEFPGRFELGNPKRVVVDFPTKGGTTSRSTLIGKNIIKKVEQVSVAGRTRLVIFLDEDVDYFMTRDGSVLRLIANRR